MNKKGYNFSNITSDFTYTFVSQGRKNIIKLVEFQPINDFIYNLALADVDLKTQKIDYENITNNSDTSKILATVIKIIIDFLYHQSNVVVAIKANHPSKQKLYHRIIKNNLDDILEFFEVFGVLSEDNTEIFNKEKEYTQIFIIQKRNIISL